jgi:hypothetical protein
LLYIRLPHHPFLTVEAVKAYPEIYFAKLVVLGEGDSEQVILPKILEHYGQDIDAHSISVVPLDGRHCLFVSVFR